MNDKLDALWAEYRDACPDPDPSANFMPQLWEKIEGRRAATMSLFRRWTEACIMATFALSLLIVAFLIPRYQREPVYGATYVDVLVAEHAGDYTSVLTAEGDRQ